MEHTFLQSFPEQIYQDTRFDRFLTSFEPMVRSSMTTTDNYWMLPSDSTTTAITRDDPIAVATAIARAIDAGVDDPLDEMFFVNTGTGRGLEPAFANGAIVSGRKVFPF